MDWFCTFLTNCANISFVRISIEFIYGLEYYKLGLKPNTRREIHIKIYALGDGNSHLESILNQ